MWILPKTLQWSNGALDTEEYISDLNEQSQICASSLMVRSKHSPARTWLQKWKRDSWTQHLSGRILKPSRAKSFATEWTSLWPVIPANRSAQQVSDKEPTIPATSGHTSAEQLGLFDLESASLKTSRDTSRLDSPQSSAIWKKMVTERRGAYSARVKSAHRTSESGCSSWPTIRASEYKDVGPVGSKSHDHMLGKHYLCAVVTQEGNGQPAQATWGTPNTMDYMEPRSPEAMKRMLEHGHRKNRKWSSNVREQVVWQEHFGQADQANHSTNGSRQGLSDQSRQNWQTFAHGTHNRGETPHRQVVKALVNGEKAKTQCLTVDQVFAEEIKGTSKQDWRTPGASDGEGGVMEMREGCAGKYKLRDHVVAEAKQWSTPRAGATDNSRPNNKGGIPLGDQARREQWGTPTARDHKSGRGNEDRDYKELTPMVERVQAGKLNPRWVETLMGVPIGWASPDPVTHTTCTNRTDELRLLGNGVVPATAYKAWTTLTGELK